MSIDVSTLSFDELEHLARRAASEIQSRISAAELVVGLRYPQHAKDPHSPTLRAAATVVLRVGSQGMIDRALTTGDAESFTFEDDILGPDPWAGSDEIRRLRHP